MEHIIALLDIGSQTIRMLVASSQSGGGLRALCRERSIVRLGENMQADQTITPAAMKRALACISSFVATAKALGAQRILMVATASVREARNRHEFLNAVQDATGVRPSVLSGTEEARLSIRGVQSAVATSAPETILFDIGGGSTELSLLKGESPTLSESISLGVIPLAESFITNNPPPAGEMAALQNHVSRVLTSQSGVLKERGRFSRRPPALVGTAGTATTLAAMDLQLSSYDPDRINGHVLRRPAMLALYHRMLAMPLARRSRLPGLEEGRALVILPGMVIALTVMDMCGCTGMTVSDSGLLEGAALAALAA